MTKKFLIGVFVTFVAVMGMTSIAQADWAGDQTQATLSFSPQEQTYAQGEEFGLEVRVDTNNQDVVAAGAYVDYNPDHFDVVGVDTSNSVFNSDNNCDYQGDPCEIINYEGSADHTPTGTIEIVKTKPSPGVNTSGGLVATINFRTLSEVTPSSDNITLNFNNNTPSSSVILDDGQGTDILSGVRSGQYSIDNTSPSFSNISIATSSQDSATISWNTNEPATTKVEYGLDTSYGGVATSSGLTTDHSISLSNLSASTTYHYRVVSEDSVGNKEMSTDRIFTNALGEEDTIPPAAVEDLNASDVTQTSVDLSWTAPGDDGDVGFASVYDIRYSTNPINASTWPQATQLEGEPTPAISGSDQQYYISVGLSPGTTYYFALKTSDEASNISSLSNIVQVTTDQQSDDQDGGSGSTGGGGGGSFSDTTPPSSPGDFSADPAENQIFLSWDNPDSSDFVRVKIFRKVGSPVESRNDPEAQIIYEGDKEEYVDANLDNDTTYHYAIVSFDQKPNYSELAKASAQPEAGKTSVTSRKDPEQDRDQKYKDINNLYGKSREIVEAVSEQGAKNIFDHNQFVPLNDTSAAIYEKVVKTKQDLQITQQDRYSIAYFIHLGTQTTKRLGAGERGGVLDSYYSAFGHLPSTIESWKDVIKIGNGRWPADKNTQRENKIKNDLFQKIYQRQPNMDNPHDNAAVTTITYGLRPANRNTNSEAAAIKIFRSIFDRPPQEAQDWDIVRAIAYSGAQR